MPNMVIDGFLVPAITVHKFSDLHTNADYLLQGVVITDILNAASTGAYTVSIDLSAHSKDLIQLLIERLVNMGYGATLSTNTLTVTW